MKKHKHNFGKKGYCSYNLSGFRGKHFDRFTCECGAIKTDPSDPILKESTKEFSLNE